MIYFINTPVNIETILKHSKVSRFVRSGIQFWKEAKTLRINAILIIKFICLRCNLIPAFSIHQDIFISKSGDLYPFRFSAIFSLFIYQCTTIHWQQYRVHHVFVVFVQVLFMTFLTHTEIPTLGTAPDTEMWILVVV